MGSGILLDLLQHLIKGHLLTFLIGVLGIAPLAPEIASREPDKYGGHPHEYTLALN
jgi:hypothetical protein